MDKQENNEKYYDYGRFIDLNGLDPKEIIENIE